MLLNGRVAIVSGASRGIGRATVTAFLEEGANVVLVSRQRDLCLDLLRQLGLGEPRAYVVTADVTRKDMVDQAVSFALEKYARIDIMVNNAGVTGAGAIEDVDETKWDDIFAVNVKATFLFSRAVIPTMKRQRSGAIINMSSVGGKVGLPFNSLYCATKHAVVGFSGALAVELAPYGIRVNAVCPGQVETDLLRNAFEIFGKEQGLSQAEYKAKVMAAAPMGRFGEPEEIAALVAFLASDKASYISGTSVALTGAAFTI